MSTLNPASDEFDEGWIVLPLIPSEFQIAKYTETAFGSADRDAGYRNLTTPTAEITHSFGANEVGLRRVAFSESILRGRFFQKQRTFFAAAQDPVAFELKSPCDGLLVFSQRMRLCDGVLVDFSQPWHRYTGVYVKPLKGQGRIPGYGVSHGPALKTLLSIEDQIWERGKGGFSQEATRDAFRGYIDRVLRMAPMILSNREFYGEYGL